MKILAKLTPFLFVFIGLVILWYGDTSYRQSQASLSWTPVMGKVITSKVIVQEDEDTDCYIDDIKYSYVVENKEYRNTNVAIGSGSCDESEANDSVKKYPAQSEVEVFYDPNQPESSTLEPGVNNISLIIAIIGGIWTGIFFLLTVLMVKRMVIPR